MALININHLSNTLQRTVDINCYFPNDLQKCEEIKGVITLLHGYTGNSSVWFKYTAVCRYAADNNLVVICPSADNSFYTDMVYGGNYYTYITKEMPEYLNKTLKIPTERSKNIIAGLSMGGYGALMIGLNNPDKYFTCASFSGAVMVDEMANAKDLNVIQEIFYPVFGENLNVPDKYKLLYLAEKVSKLPKEEQPNIYVTCGLQDEDNMLILSQNKMFQEGVSKMDLPCTFEYWNGVHEWNFWDVSIAKTIDKYFNNGYFQDKVKNTWGNQF